MHFYKTESDLLENVRTRVSQLTLEVTERCPFRCLYCRFTYQNPRQAQPRDMSWTTARNALDLFVRNSSDAKERAISFWGGEPLVNVGLIRRVVKYAEQTCPNATFNFTTNASLITPEVAHFLARHRFRLLVSLDGPAHVHNRFRKTLSGRGTFAATTAGLTVLAEAEPEYFERDVRINCVITPGSSIREIVNFFESDSLCRTKTVTLSLMSSSGTPLDHLGGAFDGAELAGLRRAALEKLVELGVSAKDPLAQFALRSVLRVAIRPRCGLASAVTPNGCCVPLLKEMLVASDGSIHLCEQIDRDNAVGNVNSGGIEYDTISRMVHEYCRNSLQDCAGCWAVRLCPTCYRQTMKQGRWAPTDRRASCDAMRRSTLESLVDYVTVLQRRPAAFEGLRNFELSVPM